MKKAPTLFLAVIAAIAFSKHADAAEEKVDLYGAKQTANAVMAHLYVDSKPIQQDPNKVVFDSSIGDNHCLIMVERNASMIWSATSVDCAK